MELEQPSYAWYAVYTKPNREKKIAEYLQKENIECYLPTTKRLKQWNDRQRWIDDPLFRSCIFVRVSYFEFFNVLNSQGVVCYVSLKGKPQVIPDYQIENIRTFVGHNEKAIVCTRKQIDRGSIAEVKSGPFRGVQGELVQINNQYKLLIRVDSLGCCIYAKISNDKVKLLNPNNSIQKREQWPIKRFAKRRKEFEMIDSFLS